MTDMIAKAVRVVNRARANKSPDCDLPYFRSLDGRLTWEDLHGDGQRHGSLVHIHILRIAPADEEGYEILPQGGKVKKYSRPLTTRREANRRARRMSRETGRLGVEVWHFRSGGEGYGHWHNHRRLAVFRRGRAVRKPRKLEHGE